VDSRVGTAFGNYNITRLLGKGGMGEVYEAYDTGKRRTVALKILAGEYSHDAKFRERFQRESHAAAILQEPHVIPIHDWGEIDGNLYIDMRLVRGQTLADLIAGGPLAAPRAVSIIAQIGAALDAAHAERLIHRDVKPQNIIVTAEDFAYLVDFGIAEAKGDTRLTMTGTQIGTMNYMAPERFTGTPTTSAVDVYALACVLFEALTGDTPFPSTSVENLISAHLSSPPPRPSVTNPRVPAALDEVIARGMAKDPDDRYGTAGGLGRAAQRALHGGTTSAVNAKTYVPQAGPPPRGVATAAPPAATRGAPWYADPYAASTQAAPTAAPSDHPSGGRGRGRGLAAVVAVGALILAGIGVVIGLLVHRNSQSASGPSPSTVYRTAEPSSAEAGSPQTAPTRTVSNPPTPVALPPLVTGPDESALHQTCDQGYTLPGAGGFGTHAGRGTPETSCHFANSVLTSYWATYGNASPLPRAVSAPGAVDCSSVPGALCNGSNFLMQCQQNAGEGWITCTGGSNARVYLW
jgi:predicted Ser/Thr protein kinase